MTAIVIRSPPVFGGVYTVVILPLEVALTSSVKVHRGAVKITVHVLEQIATMILNRGEQPRLCKPQAGVVVVAMSTTLFGRARLLELVDEGAIYRLIQSWC